MSRTKAQRARRLRVRSVRRDPPDLTKLGRALIAIALAQAQDEAEAEAEHRAKVSGEETPHAA
jgi:hypothetical protein